MSLIESLHDRHIVNRRIRVISSHLSNLMPERVSVLDVGCGDGKIAWLLGQQRPDLKLTGVEVLVRDNTPIPIQPFNGQELPFSDNSFDVVSFVDVLHHCTQPMELLREAHRVARREIIIKDHCLMGIAAHTTLRFMDWVGNHRYGVALPYNYWRSDQWQFAFADLKMVVEEYRGQLGLYCWPFSMLFDRKMHFMARLAITSAAPAITNNANKSNQAQDAEIFVNS
jgi:SAM-dependent methyltransferase